MRRLGKNSVKPLTVPPASIEMRVELMVGILTIKVCTAQPRNRAIVRGIHLPYISLLPSLPDLVQQFSRFYSN